MIFVGIVTSANIIISLPVWRDFGQVYNGLCLLQDDKIFASAGLSQIA